MQQCGAGELLVGPKKTLFLDEISTGLDSSTTFQITRTLREFSHLRAATMLVALLQPTPETYDLFDDIMLLSEGNVLRLLVMMQGTQTQILESGNAMVTVVTLICLFVCLSVWIPPGTSPDTLAQR